MTIPPASLFHWLSAWLSRLRQHLFVNRYVVFVNSVLIGVLIALALNAVIYPYGGVIIKRLFEEPFSTKYPYLGVLVLASEILWGATGAICLFTFIVLRRLSSASFYRWFILCSGLVTILLVFDDTFRLTTWLNVMMGVPKLLSYGLYGGAAIAIGIIFRRVICATPYLLLVFAALLFLFSTGVDLAGIQGQGLPAMLEDGSKLLGILNIGLYYCIVCQTAILHTCRAQKV